MKESDSTEELVVPVSVKERLKGMLADPTLEKIVHKFGETGVVHLRENIFPKEYLKTLSEAAAKDVAAMQSRLEKLNINYHSQTHSFSFNEVASRCPGRIDFRHNLTKFLAPDSPLLANPILQSILSEIFQDDFKFNFGGIVSSFPGSKDQEWHQDGSHLFPELEDMQLPTHAVTIFIPLIDVDQKLGPTQYVPKSHKLEIREGIMELLIDDKIDAVEKQSVSVTGAVRGSATIFDYRLIHRGVANTDTRERSLLYLVFSKSWWTDVQNFDERHSFFDSNIDAVAATLEKGDCSFSSTRKKLVWHAELFSCSTCKFADGLAMCAACVKKCHSGHKIADLGSARGYCDCGAAKHNI
eukprot:TRINITY_DN20093_c0_g1_i1.p1 TRINITY_DN20093_c0_g1~~TRINITY_DN20093_c0_g1_i1.p1  ORF type:complete len:364 (+),score=55.91 TRINITY_DN20093_c0_g1_i1:30-1094(+)